MVLISFPSVSRFICFCFLINFFLLLASFVSISTSFICFMFLASFVSKSHFFCFFSNFWDYALQVRLDEIVYVHCHQDSETGGTIILVGQDGVQRPPIHFPKGIFPIVLLNKRICCLFKKKTD